MGLPGGGSQAPGAPWNRLHVAEIKRVTKAKRAVFLDRDNTIIQNDGDLGDPDEVKLVRGAAHVIASLRQLGFQIVVVTNQGGVARGKYTERDVDAVHQRIANMVRESSGGLIDRFYYCPFHPEGNVPEYTREHPWRKPNPGMLLQAAKDLDLDLTECWMVGDAERDIQAGRRAECKTILIARHPNNVRTTADFRAETLAEAAAIVAQNRTRPKTSPRPIKVGAAAAASENPLVETTAAVRGGAATTSSPTERPMDPQAVAGQRKLVSKMHPRLDDVATTLDDTAHDVEFVPVDDDAALSSPVISDSQASELLARTRERDEAAVDDENEAEVDDRIELDDEDDDAEEETDAVDEVDVDDDDDDDEEVDDDDDEEEGDTDDDDEYEYEYEYEYEEEDEDEDEADTPTRAASSSSRVMTPQERVRHLAPGETDPRVFRAINDLATEIRAWRLGAPEFTPGRMLVQLVLIGILLLAMAIAIYVDDRTDALIWVGVTLIGQLTLIGLLALNRR